MAGMGCGAEGNPFSNIGTITGIAAALRNATRASEIASKGGTTGAGTGSTAGAGGAGGMGGVASQQDALNIASSIFAAAMDQAVGKCLSLVTNVF
jgi:hypothetical protein